jgi:hypothetical protein
VSADPEDLAEAFTAILLNESRNAPDGCEFILTVTASDFSVRVCISNASDAASVAPALRNLDRPAARGDPLLAETMVPSATVAFASGAISAAGGMLETLTSNELRGRQFVVTLPLAT